MVKDVTVKANGSKFINVDFFLEGQDA